MSGRSQAVAEPPADPPFSALVAERVDDPRQSGPPERHGRRRRGGRAKWVALVVVVALLAAVGGAGWYAYQHYPVQVKTLFGWSDDWTGHGSGSAQVTVRQGDTGQTVAQTLASAGVIKTSDAFYNLLLATKPEPTFDPGTYRLAKHQSAASALAQLQSPSALVVSTVTIPEGSTVKQILAITADATGVPLSTLQAEAQDYTALGVPKSAPNLEGYLFPATYRFPPKTSAHTMLTTMVQRMYQALDSFGVKKADREHVLTFAGLVQKEGNGSDDAKVARVFLNRLAKGMLLQSDATVSYGAGGTTVVPTAKQYASKNGYNTYIHTGLPKGPISNPGDVAIKAVLHPASGKWLFFVTVDLETGKTVFSTTEAQHEKASAEFDAWLAKHPSYKK